MSHTHFDRWQDDAGNVRVQCQGCHDGHTFKSAYFARDWANRHAYGIVTGTIRGLA